MRNPMKNNLFIKKIVFERDKVSDFSKYPFSIPLLQNFYELEFSTPVTFLIGENGIGKSTLIEAIALHLGLSSESGTENFLYKSKDTHSSLYKYITLHKSGLVPTTKYFLRAESFYNFSTEMQRLIEEDGYTSLSNYYGGKLHECSHGEAFLKVVQNRFSDGGLYILDELEAALSPSHQMSLLCMIDNLAKNGSQFIIATHSPILISYQNGTILDLNQDFKEVDYKETEIYETYKLFLDNPEKMQEYLFLKEEE